MSRVFLRQCQPGDYLDDVFVISQKQLSTTSTNKPYIKCMVADRTSQVTARIWNASRSTFEALPDSGFVRLKGRVENYQGNLQVIIDEVRPAALGDFNVADLIAHTTRDIPTMREKLTKLCLSVQNRHLKAVVQAYLDDTELMERLCKAPAAQSYHHAFIGGLLEHTLNAMEVADAIARFYPGLNRDLVVVGILLHDIAKTWELSYDCAFGYTDGGQLVGHIVKSAIWVEHKAKAAAEKLGEPIPQALVDVLQHIIVSHHGVPEFGAVKVPATPEAVAVHFIENLDAKMMMSLAATRGEAAAGAEGNWTEYMRSMSTRLYRPDVAPPDGSTPPAAPASPGRRLDESTGQVPPTMKLAVSNPLFESARPGRRG